MHANVNCAGPTDIVIGLNDSASMLTISANLSVLSSSVAFNLSAYLVNNTVSINYANSTIITDQNSLKFSLGLQGWPFRSKQTLLHVSLGVLASGGVNVAVNESNASGIRFSFGDASLTFPTRVVLDETTSSDMRISSSVDKDQLTIDLYFPWFNHSLFYDPVATIASQSTRPSLGLSIEVIIGISCSAGIIAVGATEIRHLSSEKDCKARDGTISGAHQTCNACFNFSSDKNIHLISPDFDTFIMKDDSQNAALRGLEP